MFRGFFLWIVVFSGVILTSGQSNPETSQLLDKAYKSLYENPDKAFQILQNIDGSKESELIRQRVRILTGRAYNLKGDFAKSIEQSIDKTLNEDRNDINAVYADFALAQQYQALRLYKQSIRISQNLVDKASKIKSQQYPENLPAYIYQLNASNLMVQKKLEEAEKNLKISKTYLKTSDEDFIISVENDIYQTYIYLAQNKISIAERLARTIEMKLTRKPEYVFLKAINLDNLGRIYFLKKDYQKSLQILMQALELIQNKSYDALRNRIYDDLSKNYLALKNEALYQKYYSSYKEQTEKLDKSKKEAIRNLVKLNDQYESKRVEASEKKHERQILLISISCLVMIVLGITLYVSEKKKSESIRKQIDFYTTQQNFRSEKEDAATAKTEKQDQEISKKTVFISKEKEADILARLQEFEKSEKFLSRDMSLAVLAGQLETNTKYLSEVINKYKEKNYNNYINELRINYIAYLLKTNPAYLNYKVSYLAEKAGFSSHSTFTTVFKSVTGISPNTYIQQLTKNQK